MKMQQVNLYLPELQPKKEWLTANTIVLTLLGFILLTAISTYYSGKEIKRYEARIELIEKQKEIIEFRIKEVQSTPRAININALEQTKKKLTKQVMAREQIGNLIQGQNLGNELGFSRAMTGFSRQSFPSVSLQHIRISRGGSFIELKGKTNVVENIPNFVRNLKKETSFHDAQFGLLSIVNVESSSLHDFTLGFESVYQLATQETK